MNIKTKQIELYVADDGKEFLSKDEAIAYENEVLSRKKNICCFRISHNPDLTEGRGYAGLTYLFVECNDPYHELMVLNWCITNFGSPLAFVQGVSRMPKWVIDELKNNSCWPDIKNLGFGSIGDVKYPAKAVFYTANPIPLLGYPMPQWFSDNW